MEKIFIEKYVKAVNAKDVSQLEQLMDPACRKCIDRSNEDYYHDQFQQRFKDHIPPNYTATIKPVSDSNNDLFQKEIQLGQKMGLNYPVNPSYQMEINYNINNDPYSSASILSFLARQGDDYYEVYVCPTPEWVEVYRKRKSDKQQETDYSNKIADVSEAYDKSLPLAQRRSFVKDEYGMLYWEEKGDWAYNWQFRSKAPIKTIEIIIVDQDGKQKTLVDNKTINGDFPLEFGFRLNDPKSMGSSINPNLSLPFGFSRIGGHALGLSNWMVLSGIKFARSVYNKNISKEDVFAKSGEITLATFNTSDGPIEFSSTIKIKYETR